MATKLYITEYAQLGVDSLSRGQLCPQEPAIATQVISYAAGAAASAAFNPDTKLVRIHTDSICSVLFGVAPVATVNHPRMAAGQTEYRAVGNPQAGGTPLKVSAISNT